MFNRRELFSRSLCFGLLPFIPFSKIEDKNNLLSNIRIRTVEKVCPKAFIEKLGRNKGFVYNHKYPNKVMTVFYENGYIEKIGDVVFCSINSVVGMQLVYGKLWRGIGSDSFIYSSPRTKIGNKEDYIYTGVDGYIWGDSDDYLKRFIYKEKERLNV